MELDPQVAFERLFGAGGNAAERAARREQDRSILDSVTSEAGELQEGSGSGDRAKLDEYETDIREIERRLTIAKKATGASLDRRRCGSGGRSGIVRRAREAAFRSAGAGVQGRHHARFHGSLCARFDAPLRIPKAA